MDPGAIVLVIPLFVAFVLGFTQGGRGVMIAMALSLAVVVVGLIGLASVDTFGGLVVGILLFAILFVLAILFAFVACIGMIFGAIFNKGSKKKKVPMLKCPHCSVLVYPGIQVCPRCGSRVPQRR